MLVIEAFDPAEDAILVCYVGDYIIWAAAGLYSGNSSVLSGVTLEDTASGMAWIICDQAN